MLRWTFNSNVFLFIDLMKLLRGIWSNAFHQVSYQGSIAALIRLQSIYKLKARELADGSLFGEHCHAGQ